VDELEGSGLIPMPLQWICTWSYRKHIFNRNGSICQSQRTVWYHSIPVLLCSVDTAAPHSAINSCQSFCWI